MVSEASSTMVNGVNVITEKSMRRSYSNKKNHSRVPKKIHKAEREKLKRDHLNELFLELDNALDTSRQNNGKASILGDATRLLRDLLAQVECLKKENVALLSESHYVTIEKDELRDETAVLEAAIGELQTQVKEKTPVEPGWHVESAQPDHSNLTPSFPKDHLTLPAVEPALQPPPVMGPVLVIPLHHDFQAYPEPGAIQIPPKTPSNVSKPHARYPTPSDSWPSQLLGEQTKKALKDQVGSKSGNSNQEERGSGNI